jgi:hypothetical protein
MKKGYGICVGRFCNGRNGSWKICSVCCTQKKLMDLLLEFSLNILEKKNLKEKCV